MTPDSRPTFTTEQGIGRLTSHLHTALKQGEDTLIEAPTGLGKTHKVATTAWRTKPNVTGGQPVIHVSPSIKTRDSAHQLSVEEEGVTPAILKGREEACSVANGDYDDTLIVPDEKCAPSEWLNRKCDAEKVPFSEAHKQLEEQCGSLPCSDNERCSAVKQWHSIFESETLQYDVLHVTQNFIYNTELIKNSNLIFDEQPTYTIEVKQEVNHASQIRRETTQPKVRQAVTDILSQVLGKNHTWESLLTAIQTDDIQTLQHYKNQLASIEVDPNWAFSRYDVHALAPAIIEALINSEDVGNDRKRGVGYYNPAVLGFGSKGQTEVIVVFDTKNNIKLIHQSPDLSETRCMIGLDAHPTLDLWKLQTKATIQLQTLLTPVEKRVWRWQERKLNVYQVDNHTRAYTTGWAGDTATERERTKARAMALIKSIQQKHESEFRTCITSKSLKSEVEQMMESVGISNPTVLHYGGIKSRDDFKSEPVGLLIGCIDPGDENILDKVALLGLSAKAEMAKKDDGTVVRATGRFFLGPDAAIADEILQSIRERNVAQAIGRYARDIHGDEAERPEVLVYVWTDAIPDGMVDDVVRGVEKNPIGKEKQIVQRLESTGAEMTAKEVVEEFEAMGRSISKTYVQDILNSLVDQGKADVRTGGAYGAYVYTVHSGALESLTVVNLEPSTTN